jgi:diguanylate cyclase (GGDEF)-like protein
MAGRFALDYMEEQSAAGADYAWRLFLIAYLTPIAMALVLFAGREQPLGWWFLAVAVASWAVAIYLGVTEEREASKAEMTGITPPIVTLLLGLSLVLATFSVEMALSPHEPTVRWLLLVPVFVIATVGNRPMLAVTTAFAAVLFALTSVDTVPTATTSWPADLFVAATLLLVFRVFAERVIRSFARDSLFGAMSEVTATADSLTDGWTRVLPLVGRYLDAETVTVLEADGSAWVPLATWPEGPMLDVDDPQVQAMLAEATTGATPVRREGSLTAIGVQVDDHSIVAFATGTATVVVDGMYQFFRSHQVGVQLRVLVSRMRSIEALAEQSRTDSLTGLTNRRSLMTGLAEAMARSRSSDGPLCAVMIDLDHFKHFNDRFGHLEGDRALVQLAELMDARTRADDIVCRFGGEEFALVLPGTSLDDAVKVIDLLRPSVRALPLQCPLSISAGVAQWDGTEGPEALLRRADQALYLAKDAGRDRVRAADTARH